MEAATSTAAAIRDGDTTIGVARTSLIARKSTLTATRAFGPAGFRRHGDQSRAGLMFATDFNSEIEPISRPRIAGPDFCVDTPIFESPPGNVHVGENVESASLTPAGRNNIGF